MSNDLRWPASDERDGVFVPIETDYEDDGTVDWISQFLAEADQLTPRLEGETFFITYHGQEWQVPLAISRHDRYITVSSVAEIIKDRYAIFIDRTTIGEEFNYLLIAAKDTIAARGPRPDYLIPLQIGFDYFSGDPEAGTALRIPYSGQNPDDFDAATFEAGKAASVRQIDLGRAWADTIVGAVFTGKIDDAKLKELVDTAAKDPKLAKEFSGQSPDELVTQLRDGLSEVMADPEIAKSSAEARQGLNDLRAMTGQPPLGETVVSKQVAPPNPWWKFW
jgi:hypothetical protein